MLYFLSCVVILFETRKKRVCFFVYLIGRFIMLLSHMSLSASNYPESSSNSTASSPLNPSPTSSTTPPSEHMEFSYYQRHFLPSGLTIFPHDTKSAFPSPTTRSGRDEVTSSGINGYNSPDSGIGSDLRRRPTSASHAAPLARPQTQEELCLVCGDRASGYHYNALTCEGCKGFFRRSITKNAVYQCKYGGNCEIDMYMRRKCQECRLRKCLAVGMRPECVVPESQCKLKREAKIKHEAKLSASARNTPVPSAITSSTTPSVVDSNDALSPKSFSPNSISVASPDETIIGLTSITENDVKPKIEPTCTSLPKKSLSAEAEELIRKVVGWQEQFELPNKDDFKNITPLQFSGDEENDRANRFQHIAEICILTVQLIVEFAKRLPGFDSLNREDQITLLKECTCELMILRAARRYDVDTDAIVFANNMPFTRDNYKMSLTNANADGLYNFCRSLSLLKTDNAEFALLTAVSIFSDRPGLTDRAKVEEIQEVYVQALKEYESVHRAPRSCMLARLLMRVTELRTLGHQWSEMLFTLKLQKRRLPALLAEIWDFDGLGNSFA